jgi:hypothetical protein
MVRKLGMLYIVRRTSCSELEYQVNREVDLGSPRHSREVPTYFTFTLQYRESEVPPILYDLPTSHARSSGSQARSPSSYHLLSYHPATCQSDSLTSTAPHHLKVMYTAWRTVRS